MTCYTPRDTLPTNSEIAVAALFCYYTLAGTLIQWGFVGPWVAHLATAFLISVASVMSLMGHLPKIALRVALTGLSSIIYAMFLDSKSILLAANWWMACTSYFVIFHRAKVTTNIIPFVTIITLASFALCMALGLDAADPGVPFNRLTLIPTAENNFIINIGPPGSTKHFAATLGGMLFMWSITQHIAGRSNCQIFILFTLVFAAYVVLFTASRAVYLGTAFATIVLFLNRKKIRSAASHALLWIGILAVYLIPIVAVEWLRSIPFDTVRALIKSTEDYEDITAGRMWLWLFHLDMFLSNPFGNGSAALAELWENATLGLAPASSESWFTALLAIYGVGALFFFLAYLAVFVRALHNCDVEMLALSVFVIITTASSSLFAQIYGPWTVVALALVSSRWTRFDERQQSRVNRGTFVSDNYPSAFRGK